MTREELMALADELESMDAREGCRTCPADGTKDCRGDLSCEEAVARAASRRIREMAGHDACEEAVTTVGAYDLLPDEDREAIEWVREKGGLEAVKASVHQGAVEHGFLLKIAHALGTSIYDGSDNADALLDKLSKRLMPEGMEWLVEAWPRFEDGEPVAFRDKGLDIHGHARSVEGVKFTQGGFVFISDDMGNTWWANDRDPMEDPEIDPGKRVKRLVPKALDAAGVEIRVGDTVWDVESGIEYEVVCIHTDEDTPVRVMRTDGSHLAKAAKPSTLTHRAPVLAADGKPLKEGDTVWSTAGEFNGSRTVKSVNVDDGEPPYAMFEECGEPWSCLCCMLTHEQPETRQSIVEKIGEDIAKRIDAIVREGRWN